MELHELAGMRVMIVLGHKKRKNQKYISPEFILFDDGETFIELESQDPYLYHDCDYKARRLCVRVSEREWESMLSFDKHGEANTGI